MVRTRTLYTIGALVVGALTSSSIEAQSAQKLSVQVSGLYVATFGEAYEGLKNGPGGEIQLRYTPSVWSFGIGAQISSHDFDDAVLGSESVKLAGVFLEPRRTIDVGSSSFAPYLSARLAFLKQSLDVDVQGTSVSASASGAQVNAGGGVLVRLTPRVNLDLGATIGLINFGDVEVTIPGVGSTTVDGSSGTGQNLVLRVGLAIGLGQ